MARGASTCRRASRPANIPQPGVSTPPGWAWNLAVGQLGGNGSGSLSRPLPSPSSCPRSQSIILSVRQTINIILCLLEYYSV